MTVDLLIRGATLPDGRKNIDIAASQGRIVAIEPAIAAEATKEIDARGRLVSPPFVDAHFHMDATLSLGKPRLNKSGTLLEGIALWGELKPLLTHEAVAERALRYCDLAVAQGLLAVRSHVDVCDDRLVAVEALIEVKRKVKPYLDLQLVAFPHGAASTVSRSRNADSSAIANLTYCIEKVDAVEAQLQFAKAFGTQMPKRVRRPRCPSNRREVSEDLQSPRAGRCRRENLNGFRCP